MVKTRNRPGRLTSVVARWARDHLALWIVAATAIEGALVILLPVLIALPHQSGATIRGLIVALVVLLVLSLVFPVTGHVLETKEKAAEQRRNALKPSTLGADVMPLRINQISDLKVFGVKSADLPDVADPYLTYVTRDDDAKLEQHMSDAVKKGQMLLVRGGSAAGKSRSTAEAARRVLPGYRLLCPRFAGERGLPAVVDLPLGKLMPAVVWLDDIDQYMHEALSDNLEQLREVGVPVIATMRHQAWDDLTTQGEVPNPVGEVLRDKRLIDRVDWQLKWSPSEYARLAGKVQDPGLLDAVKNEMPVGVYCIAGPQLLERVEDTLHAEEWPWRYALIRTVLEWYRTGIATAAPLTVVTELMPHVASEEGFPLDVKYSYQDMDDALNWFKSNVLGGRGQQSQQSVITVLYANGELATALKVHDHVLDHYLPDVSILTDEIWYAALQGILDNSAAFRISVAAYSQDRGDIALIAIKPLAEQGNHIAMYTMGALLIGSDLRSAQIWVERALGSGDNAVVPLAQAGLGGLLLGLGEDPERAKELLEAAIESGDPQAVPLAQANLGALLLALGEDLERAKELLEAAIESGNPQAVPLAQANLGALLGLGEDLERAKELLEAAIESGNPQAVPLAQANLGGMLVNRGETRSAPRSCWRPRSSPATRRRSRWPRRTSARCWVGGGPGARQGAAGGRDRVR